MNASYRVSSSAVTLIDRSKSTPTLTREEEIRLHRRWKKQHDPEARDALVRANLRYVVSMAMSYRHYPVPIDDLIAEGSLGLLVAIDKFDPKRGFRLVTYASYWMRAYIITHVMKSWVRGKTRMSAVRSRMFFKLRRDRARVGAQFGEKDGLRHLAEETGMTEDRLSDVLAQLDTPDFPLEAESDDMEWGFFRERLASRDPDPESSCSTEERKTSISSLVRTAVDRLDQRERFIIERRVMEDEPESLASIGRRMGISRERTRQLEMRARRKLMRSLTEAGVTGECAHEMLA